MLTPLREPCAGLRCVQVQKKQIEYTNRIQEYNTQIQSIGVQTEGTREHKYRASEYIQRVHENTNLKLIDSVREYTCVEHKESQEDSEEIAARISHIVSTYREAAAGGAAIAGRSENMYWHKLCMQSHSQV